MRRRRYYAQVKGCGCGLGQSVTECSDACPAQAKAQIGDLTSTEFLYTRVPGCEGLYSLDDCYERLNGMCVMGCMGIREGFEKEQARKADCSAANMSCANGCSLMYPVKKAPNSSFDSNSIPRSLCVSNCNSDYRKCMGGTAQSLMLPIPGVSPGTPSVPVPGVTPGTPSVKEKLPLTTDADCTAGPPCASVVSQVQQAIGVKADGKWGPASQAALGSRAFSSIVPCCGRVPQYNPTTGTVVTKSEPLAPAAAAAVTPSRAGGFAVAGMGVGTLVVVGALAVLGIWWAVKA